MSELVSAYPTAGGIYWWASELGGKGWGWFTGWFNLVGLDRGRRLGRLRRGAVRQRAARPVRPRPRHHELRRRPRTCSARRSCSSSLILALHALINIYSSPLVARFNSISVWLARLGVAVIIAILDLRPRRPRRASTSSSPSASTTPASARAMFWYYVLPLGFLLTMYTQTGYDASAHVSEETTAPRSAPRRACGARCSGPASSAGSSCWRSRSPPRDSNAVNEGGGSSLAIFNSAMSPSGRRR